MKQGIHNTRWHEVQLWRIGWFYRRQVRRLKRALVYRPAAMK